MMKQIKQFMANKSQKYLIIMITLILLGLILLGGVIFGVHYLISKPGKKIDYTPKEPIYQLSSPDNTMEKTKDDKGEPIIIEYNSDKQKIKTSSFYQNGQISNTDEYNPETGHKIKSTIYNLDGSIYHSYLNSEDENKEWIKNKESEMQQQIAEKDKVEKDERERKRIAQIDDDLENKKEVEVYDYTIKSINEFKRLIDLQRKIDNNIFTIKSLLNRLNFEDKMQRIEAGLPSGGNFFQKEKEYVTQLQNSLQAIFFPEMPQKIDNSDDPKYWTNDRFNRRRRTIAYHEERIKQLKEYENQLKDVEPQLKEYESRVNQLKNELPEPEGKK